MTLNALPDDKILAFSHLRAFADNNFNVNQNSKFVFDAAENIERQEDKPDFQ